ncbi:uncharacterized protein C8A04DRAFT_15018 [Dichotomopilus funicola]|uniref:C2H2-type domain-containing protein n=1 Tax=Dichotomopilus funicola TaxID=1934379 RepID=A0AAN6ZJ46_9PEZI|nr:hypothetical protein C8A04DRAFT_15018 [Dichotomopilus funicola]
MDNKKGFASLMEDHSSNPSIVMETSDDVRFGAPGGEAQSTYPAPSHSGLDLDLAPDHGTMSCVTKETPQEDCARHRFIVWAAVKRNSSVRMSDVERLECPLLRCRKRFLDHESMLKHLAECRHLASGEYWCYHHMRVERFDDVKCRRCLGHPSKRRKMLSMAKNFFHSLGHKTKKPSELGFVDETLLQPPPAYESLDIPEPDASASELPSSTEILEIDSLEVPLLQNNPVLPPMSVQTPTPTPTPTPALNDGINPQALLVPPPLPAIPELDSNGGFLPWLPITNFTPGLSAGNELGPLRDMAARPGLQLTTPGLTVRRPAVRPAPKPASTAPRSSMGLSPSSSVRSTASTDTNASTVSYTSSMVSSDTNWSGAWSMGTGLDTNLTSPVDGTMGDELFADVMNTNPAELCPDTVHTFFSELPADLPMLENACDMGSDADALLGFEPVAPTGLTYAPEILAADIASQAAEIAGLEVEKANTCCSETKSLVGTAWDALQEHILSSMVKIQGYENNHVAGQLRSMSIKTVATTGLRTLRNLLNGEAPSTASDALCLIHLVYSFSLILHGQEAPGNSTHLFIQALGYSDRLPPHDKTLYNQLVTTIWQPPEVSLATLNKLISAVSASGLRSASDPSGKGKSRELASPVLPHREDALLAAAQDFLDELEISLLNQGDLPLDVQISELHITHLKEASPAGPVNEALISTAKGALVELSRRFNDAGLKSGLEEVYQKIQTSSICSVRRIEVEILRAGKTRLPSSKFFGVYVPHVRKLCDQLYMIHDVGVSRRDVYHGLGVTLIETLVSELDNSGSKLEAQPPDDIDMFLNEIPEVPSPPAAKSPGKPPPLKTKFSQTQLLTPTASSSGSSPSDTTASPTTASPATTERPQRSPAETPDQQSSNGQKVEANSCCDICGYRPKGDPQWFKGSMAKHRRLQHSTEPPKIFKCPFPGCTSQYKNRQDNLRQHQIEKNHWVEGDEGPPRRPSKRRRVAEDD